MLCLILKENGTLFFWFKIIIFDTKLIKTDRIILSQINFFWTKINFSFCLDFSFKIGIRWNPVVKILRIYHVRGIPALTCFTIFFRRWVWKIVSKIILSLISILIFYKIHSLFLFSPVTIAIPTLFIQKYSR